MVDAHPLEKVGTPPSLKGVANSAIKGAILSLKFEPGMPLVENDLAQRWKPSGGWGCP